MIPLLCQVGLHWHGPWVPAPYGGECCLCRCGHERYRTAIAAAARQGGDGTAPGEAPQSGGDSRIAQHQEGASHAR
jgi:hypothetical protein